MSTGACRASGVQRLGAVRPCPHKYVGIRVMWLGSGSCGLQRVLTSRRALRERLGSYCCDMEGHAKDSRLGCEEHVMAPCDASCCIVTWPCRGRVDPGCTLVLDRVQRLDVAKSLPISNSWGVVGSRAMDRDLVCSWP